MIMNPFPPTNNPLSADICLFIQRLKYKVFHTITPCRGLTESEMEWEYISKNILEG